MSALFQFVRGSAQTVAETRQAAAATGVSDQEWWSSRAGLLREVAPDFADRFPHSVRLAQEAAQQDPEQSWEQGLDDTFTVGLSVLLDGIEVARDRDGVGANPTANGSARS